MNNNFSIQTEILIASIKPFTKVNEDGTQWHADIIDGLVFGSGCVNQFVPVSNIKGTIREGSQYPCELRVKTKNGKLAVDITIKGEK